MYNKENNDDKKLEIKNEIKRLNKQIIKVKKKYIIDLKNMLNELTNSFNNLNGKVNSITTDMTENNKEIKTNIDTIINDINTNNNTLTEEMNKVNTTVSELDSNVSQLDTKVNELNVINKLPIGTIIMWNKSSLPDDTKWRWCNGNDNTPNLTYKFPLGGLNHPTSEEKPVDNGGVIQTENMPGSLEFRVKNPSNDDHLNNTPSNSNVLLTGTPQNKAVNKSINIVGATGKPFYPKFAFVNFIMKVA